MERSRAGYSVRLRVRMGLRLSGIGWFDRNLTPPVTVKLSRMGHPVLGRRSWCGRSGRRDGRTRRHRGVRAGGLRRGPCVRWCRRAWPGWVGRGCSRGVRIRAERALDRDNVGDVGLVGGHPAVDGGGEIIEVLDDEGAAGVVAVGADAVEGEDEGVAELVDVAAEPEGGRMGEVGAGDELGGDGRGSEAAEGAGDGAVGTDQDAGMVEAERTQDVHGVGVAAAGGDYDLDAGGLGGVEGGEVARADAAVVAEQGAVHIDAR